MRPEPRSEIAGLSPAVHGGDAPPGVLDFSTGISPLPPPPAVLHAIRQADVRRYPHPTARPLREAIAAAQGVAPKEVVAGAGSVELIWALARAFAGSGREALVFAPAFGEYAQAVRASGGRVTELRARAPDFNIDQEPALAQLRRGPALAFLCRPSNPCLSVAPLSLLDTLAAAAPSTLFVVDEAYQPMFDDVAPAQPRSNVAVLRSLTKVFALPGLRLGYLIADATIARAVQAALPPWNVSSPAIAGGIAAIDELRAVSSVRDEIRRLREAMARRLDAAPSTRVATGGPFLLYNVGGAVAFGQQLAERGCRVRVGDSFGLPSFVRVGVRGEDEQEVLAKAWRDALRHQPGGSL